MGQFSWLDCKSKTQILDNVEANVYVLIPQEFGGGHIHETCYEGYGEFCGVDVYNLVAYWNRKYLSEHPNFKVYRSGGLVAPVSVYPWYKDYANLNLTLEEVIKRQKHIELREIGIDIACYSRNNFSLPYPIKVTHYKNAKYEDCEASLDDPNQGWKSSKKFRFGWYCETYEDVMNDINNYIKENHSEE